MQYAAVVYTVGPMRNTGERADDGGAVYSARQVQAILNYGRLEGAPSSVEEIVADLKAAEKWPAR